MRDAVLTPLELPRREALNVDMEIVQAGVVTVTRELNLELHLATLDKQDAHGARSAGSGPPQVRSGARAGSLPLRMASRAFSRSVLSSDIG